MVEQPGTDFWAIDIKYVGLGLKLVLSLVYPGFNLLVFLWKGCHENQGADIMEKTCQEILVRINLFFLTGDALGQHCAFVRMIPESVDVEVVCEFGEFKKLHGRRADGDIANGIQSQIHHRRFDGGNLFCQVYMGRGNDGQQFCSKCRIPADNLGYFVNICLFSAAGPDQLQHYLGQLGQGGGPFYLFKNSFHGRSISLSIFLKNNVSFWSWVRVSEFWISFT